MGILTLVALSAACAAQMSVQDYADKFYKEWSAPIDPGDEMIDDALLGNFKIAVPASMEAGVLDRIFDRACSAKPEAYHVIYLVLHEMYDMQNVTLSPRFEANIDALAKDSKWIMRREALDFFSELKRDKDHDLFVGALNDPNDDVRGAAIDGLWGRPDAEVLFHKYINDHQSDPAYQTSVAYAKAGLRAIQEKANSHSRL